MELIRNFRPEDTQPVSQLFQKVFRHTNDPAPESLISYFNDIYLHNPWRDDKINSLVYERDGIISGFLGAIPFPMSVNGKAVRAAISGNYMIDPEHPNPLAGVKILKTLLSGPQDVTYSDTATATARRIWNGLGSSTIEMFSMQWLKVLRPLQFALVMGARNTFLFPFVSLIRPLTRVVDSSLSAISRSPFHIKETTLDAEDLSLDAFLNAIEQFSAHEILKPAYTKETLSWLLKKAEEKREFGRLKKIVLVNKLGNIQGWYLYYPNAGKLGHVLQLGANRHTVDAVLSHLFADACDEGSTALAGRIEPKFIQEFSSHQCLFMHRNSSLVVHSKNTEIVNALYCGEAFFTRLEGEWWTRLQGDTFREK
jgi:hypothetical protein